MQRRHLLLAPLAGAALLPRLAQAAPEYQLLRAEYGTGYRRLDVTPMVERLIRDGRRVRVDNDLFGRDPAEGERKRLRLSVLDRKGRERSFDYAEGSWFDSGRFWVGQPAQRPDDDGSWRILHARYGVAGANVDVTQRLRELARSDQRFRLDNALFGVDPAPGQVKTLRIVARASGGRRRSFEYTEGSVIDGQQFTGWRGGDWGGDSGDWDDGWQGGGGGYEGPARPPRLLIERAEYRADDGRGLDVSELLAREAADGRLRVAVANRSFGRDPAPGVPKRLVIRYRVDGGRVREQSWREGETAVLP